MNDIGFIFDFNGTLFIDSDKHEAAWRSFARNYFHRDITDEEFRENIHGWNTEKIFDSLSGGKPITDDIDKLAVQCGFVVANNGLFKSVEFSELR